MKKITKKDLLFARELADKINPKSAAMTVYGGDKLDEKVEDAYELIRRPEMQSEFEKAQNDQDLIWQVKRFHLAKRLMRLADGDIRVLYDDEGNPKSPHELTFEEQYLIKKCKSKTVYDSENDKFTTVSEYEIYDRITAMTRVASLFGLNSIKKITDEIEELGKGLSKLLEYDE